MKNLTTNPIKAFVLALTTILFGICGGCESGTQTEPPAGAPAAAPKQAVAPAPRQQPQADAGDMEAAQEQECFVMVEAQPDYGAPPLEVSFTVDIECTEGASVNYAWDFGDGSPASSEASPTHVYKSDGDYPVTLKVTDSSGATGYDEVDIFVEDDAEEAG
jgi:hypothetical protein